MMPTVVGHIFGSANMSVTMGMILTSWTFGYLLVRQTPLSRSILLLANLVYRDLLSQATSWKPVVAPTMALLHTDLQCTLPVRLLLLRRLSLLS
jgi:hypothetical protein